MTAEEEEKIPFCVDSVAVVLHDKDLLGWSQRCGVDVALALNRQVFPTRTDLDAAAQLGMVHTFLPSFIYDFSGPETLATECFLQDFQFDCHELYFNPDGCWRRFACIQQECRGAFAVPPQTFSTLPSLDLALYFYSSLSSRDALDHLEPFYGFSTFFEKLLLSLLLCQGNYDVWIYHLIPVFYSMFPDSLGTIEVNLLV